MTSPPQPPAGRRPPGGALAGLIVAFVLWFFGAALNAYPAFGFVFGAQVDILRWFTIHGLFTAGLLLVCVVGVVVASLLRRSGRRTTLVGWLTAAAVLAGWIAGTVLVYLAAN